MRERPADAIPHGHGGDHDPDVDATLAALSHAVANALHTIAAASELAKLLIARQEVAKAVESLARVASECMRAARLMRDGRAFIAFDVRTGSGDVDIVALAHACAAGFDHRVEVVAERMLPTLAGNARTLRRLFAEILTNAFEFGARRVRVVLSEAAVGSSVRIDFYDDGPGLPMDASRLFKPFVSTSPDGHSGLGLALATRIADAHAGSIGVDYADGRGAVWVKLPMRRVRQADPETG